MSALDPFFGTSLAGNLDSEFTYSLSFSFSLILEREREGEIETEIETECVFSNRKKDEKEMRFCLRMEAVKFY